MMYRYLYIVVLALCSTAYCHLCMARPVPSEQTEESEWDNVALQAQNSNMLSTSDPDVLNNSSGNGSLSDSLKRSHALDSLLQLKVADTLLNAKYIGFREYLAAVAAHNLDFAVQKYNISIAQAQVTIAQLYPDPQLSVGYTKDVSSVPTDQKFGDVWNVSASETILLGGKIGARNGVAEQNISTARAQTEDFFRNLRATAAQAYIA